MDHSRSLACWFVVPVTNRARYLVTRLYNG